LELGLLEIKETSYIDEWSRHQRMVELTERGALIAMPFIGGARSREGQKVLVDAFLALRDRQSIEWQSSRKLAAIGYTVMSDTLLMVREDAGKTTAAHHYCNEAKLINSAVFGQAASTDRNQLDQQTLRLLERVEIRNSALIAQGKTYQDRKCLLRQFVCDYRAKLTSQRIANEAVTSLVSV
jgi:hypothetical protein